MTEILESLFAFLITGFALTGSPGPATLSLAATGAAFGARRGLGYMAGINTGILAVMGLTASGVTGVLLALPGAAPFLVGVAAAYFAYLAYRIATAPPLGDSQRQGRSPSFAAGFLLNLANPKAYAAMTALFGGFILVEDHLALDAAAKVVLLLGTVVTVNLCWLLSGAALTRFFHDPTISRVINLIFAGLLVASVVITLLL